MSRRAGAIPEETRAKLMKSAALEFAECGFDKASLRRICANAEVTTGALYFFFEDKEDLFGSIIEPITERILSLMKDHYELELASPVEELVNDASEDFRAADEFLDLYYANRSICELILNNRSHPAVVAFFDHIIELFDKQTILLIKQLHPKLAEGSLFNECTVHWISHLQLDAVLHIISHDFDEARAKEQLRIMVRFLRGGFLALLQSKRNQ